MSRKHSNMKGSWGLVERERDDSLVRLFCISVRVPNAPHKLKYKCDET